MQRFKRTPLVEGEWDTHNNRFIHIKRNVKVGDIVVAVGTRGKYYEVVDIRGIEQQPYYNMNFEMLLRKVFDGFKDKGLVKSRSKRNFWTRTGWYDVITPINEEVAEQVKRLVNDE